MAASLRIYHPFDVIKTQNSFNNRNKICKNVQQL